MPKPLDRQSRSANHAAETRTGDTAQASGFKSESCPASFRNGGRLQIGIRARIRRNPHDTTRRRPRWPNRRPEQCAYARGGKWSSRLVFAGSFARRLEANARLVAVGELNAGSLEGALNCLDRSGLEQLPGLQPCDRVCRDLRGLGQFAHPDIQGGARHPALSCIQFSLLRSGFALDGEYIVLISLSCSVFKFAIQERTVVYISPPRSEVRRMPEIGECVELVPGDEAWPMATATAAQRASLAAPSMLLN